MKNQHLLSIADLGSDGIAEVLHLAESFEEVGERAIPRVPALRGRTVATIFFEDSTRTRLSFETAAKRLSADTMSFSAKTSSLSKGESIRDTVETIDAMGVDAMVVRHRCAGVPNQVSTWIQAKVINAGDGWHEHPTQALSDCYTLIHHFKTGPSLKGLRIAIVGDIEHSRVARSNVAAFCALGATVILVAPPTLLPSHLDHWPVSVSHSLDAVIGEVDVVYMLRVQTERMDQSRLPSVHEYVQMYGLTPAREMKMKPTAVVMHPGPMNRGVEISAGVADGERSLIRKQVANGVTVRMAALFMLLGTSPANDSQLRGSLLKSAPQAGPPEAGNLQESKSEVFEHSRGMVP